jgi:hypothetical protein
LFQTFTEQFAFPQNALDAVAVTPAEFGKRAPTANPGSVYVLELTSKSPP